MCLKFYKLDPCHYFSSPALDNDIQVKFKNAGKLNLDKAV